MAAGAVNEWAPLINTGGRRVVEVAAGREPPPPPSLLLPPPPPLLSSSRYYANPARVVGRHVGRRAPPQCPNGPMSSARQRGQVRGAGSSDPGRPELTGETGEMVALCSVSQGWGGNVLPVGENLHIYKYIQSETSAKEN